MGGGFAIGAMDAKAGFSRVGRREVQPAEADSGEQAKQRVAVFPDSSRVRLFFEGGRRILLRNCCVIPDLAKHTSGRKPTF